VLRAWMPALGPRRVGTPCAWGSHLALVEICGYGSNDCARVLVIMLSISYGCDLVRQLISRNRHSSKHRAKIIAMKTTAPQAALDIFADGSAGRGEKT
jgi:hypothetical protein